jgi:hypothetical protein
VLGAPEALKTGPEEFPEKVVLRLEIPVEDAFADPQLVADVPDGRTVVALVGEEAERGLDDLLASLGAPLGEFFPHPRHLMRVRRVGQPFPLTSRA